MQSVVEAHSALRFGCAGGRDDPLLLYPKAPESLVAAFGSWKLLLFVNELYATPLPDDCALVKLLVGVAPPFPAAS